MTLPTIVILIIIGVIAYYSIRFIARNGLSCEADCSSCHGNCHVKNNLMKARKKFERERKIRAFLHLSTND